MTLGRLEGVEQSILDGRHNHFARLPLLDARILHLHRLQLLPLVSIRKTTCLTELVCVCAFISMSLYVCVHECICVCVCEYPSACVRVDM